MKCLSGRRAADVQFAESCYPLTVPKHARAKSVAEDGQPTHIARPSKLWLSGEVGRTLALNARTPASNRREVYLKGLDPS